MSQKAIKLAFILMWVALPAESIGLWAQHRLSNYEACLYGLSTCQPANLSAILYGLSSCQTASLSPTERQAVREAATRRNYQACLYGLSTCQTAYLSAAERHAVQVAAAKRNYQACLYGLVSCQMGSLSPSERQAIDDAAAHLPKITSVPRRLPGLTFRGYPCTADCSGHEAGYEWAEAHGIDDESDCTGNSQSFIEGCVAYVEEQEGDTQLSDEDDDADDYDDDE